MTEPFVKHLMAVSSEYGDAMREAANMIEELTADRDRMTRRYEAEADIARAGERLYRVIVAQGGTTYGGPFGDALENLGNAIRASHDWDGGGR